MPDNTVQTIRAGFLPLTDSAPLVLAHELGLDREHGLSIELVRLPSWAAMRDHLAFEKLECAHMLGGLSLAMHLGLSGLQTAMKVPLFLGSGGNAITISEQVYAEALALNLGDEALSRKDSASLIRGVALERKSQNAAPLRFAVVHAFSSHNYEMRSWLAQGGIDPERDVELVVIPPAKMVDALKSGVVDGYCVGEPWSQMAVEAGIGRIVATKADLFPGRPEKVLAFRRGWLTGHRDIATKMVDVIAEAVAWAVEPSNHDALAKILSHPSYLDVDPDLILRSLECRPLLVPGGEPEVIENYLSFGGFTGPGEYEEAVRWLLMQMRRSEQIQTDCEQQALHVFEPFTQEIPGAVSASQNDTNIVTLVPGADETKLDTRGHQLAARERDTIQV